MLIQLPAAQARMARNQPRVAVGRARAVAPSPAAPAMPYDAPRDPRDWTHGMNSGLADFIERHSETIIEHAITFAKTVDVATPMDDAALRDHLPDIVQAIVADLRTPQTRAEEIEKSEGRALSHIGQPRSAAGTHALHRAHSGYSISNLVSEYRALRASVLRLWSAEPER